MSTLLQQIKNDQLAARKNKETIKAILLTTLIAEVSAVGKKENRETTNDEAIKVIQKFVKGNDETLEALKFSSDERVLIARTEKTILESYLPQMASEDAVKATVDKLKTNGCNNVGEIMKILKLQFGATLDGKMASRLAKG